MIVVSTKEFESNPGKYLDKVEEGVEILVKKGRKQFCRIIPAKKDETLLTKEEFFARVDKAIEQSKQCPRAIARSKEELVEYLDSL
jgi:antitoxin (DNA-binding transcriptional repressor) of toxin-antitoxin stability system